jgi:magnesium-transporting ATPase (P-type)
MDHPRIDEIPFSSDTKRMTVVVRDPNGTLVHIITKGATESDTMLVWRSNFRKMVEQFFPLIEMGK